MAVQTAERSRRVRGAQAPDDVAGLSGSTAGPAVVDVLRACPTAPWRPTRFAVPPANRRTTSTRPRGPILGNLKLDGKGEPVLDRRGRQVREIVGWRTPGRDVPCWILTITVDGHEFRKRYPKSGHAEAARLELEADFHARLCFDPKTKCFVRSKPIVATTTATVYGEAVSYMRSKWPEWEPKTRREGAKALRRACLSCLRSGAPGPSEHNLEWLDWILKAPAAPREHPASLEGAEEFWLNWSASIAEVTVGDLQSLVERYRRNQRNPEKLTSPDTERRFVADLRQFWADASSRLDFRDPWPQVRLRTKGRGGQRSATTGVRAVDPEVVLSPVGVWWLAGACAYFGSWGGGTAVFVLLMGVCGLRPSEALGVRIEDLVLPASGPGWVTVRRSKRVIADHWLDPDEDREWGPLKDRDLIDSRRVPMPQVLVRYLQDEHIPRHCEGRRRGLLLVDHRGKPYDINAFTREVWAPSCAVVFPSDGSLPPDSPQQPRPSRLRRHDLRHAACSVWLSTPNIDLKVAQRWSGHRTLSVFLDIYQGIMPGREVEAAAALDDAFS